MAVDTLNDILHLHLVSLQELVANIGQSRILEDGIEERTAQHGTTALVAKDITQRRRVLYYLRAVVQTTISTRAEDTGNACLVLTQRTGRCRQVAMYLDGLRRQHFGNELRHHRHLVGRTATTIEEHAHALQQWTLEQSQFDKLGTRERGKLRQQLDSENLANITCCLVNRGDALGVKRGDNNVATLTYGRVEKGPISLSASAICNEYHHIFKGLTLQRYK